MDKSKLLNIVLFCLLGGWCFYEKFEKEMEYVTRWAKNSKMCENAEHPDCDNVTFLALTEVVNNRSTQVVGFFLLLCLCIGILYMLMAQRAETSSAHEDFKELTEEMMRQNERSCEEMRRMTLMVLQKEARDNGQSDELEQDRRDLVRAASPRTIGRIENRSKARQRRARAM